MQDSTLRGRALLGGLITLAGLAALTLAAAHPFMRGTLPLSADGALHLLRLVTLDHALADGTLWPRYVPGLVYGYGSPMFNYYSPLSLFPMLGITALGATYLQAWLWGMIAYTFTAGLGAFLLARSWGGAVAGWIAAAAFVYAPYTLFDAVGRGTVSEYMSLAVLPFVLWAMKRLIDRGGRADFALTAGSTALFILIHNVITLHGAALIGVYGLLLMAFKPRGALKLMLALGLAAGMTAFFWLPALSETGYVKLDAITAVMPEIDVTRNLGTLGAVLAPPVQADLTQMQPPTPITLSWVQIGLAVLALILAFRRGVDRRVRALVVVSALLIAVLVFMNLSESAFLWRVIPLIRYSQFPWRLLGLASLLLALLSGLAGAWLIARIGRRWLAGVTLAVLVAAQVIYGLPWTYLLPREGFDPRSISDTQDFERETGLIGTSSFGEYVPVWSSAYPDSERLRARYAAADIIPRLEVPDGVRVSEATWTHTSGRLTLDAAQEATLVFDWFFYPGWTATLDSQPVPVGYTTPEGLVTVSLPAGMHTLEIWLAPTDRQSLAVTVSAAAGLLALALLAVPPLWRGSRSTAAADPRAVRWAVTVLIIGAALFALKAAVIDTVDNSLRHERFAGGAASGVQMVTGANYGSVIELIGVDGGEWRAPSGGDLPLALYWRLRAEPVAVDYSTVLTLRHPEGMQLAQDVAWQPAGLSTSNWVTDAYLQEPRRLRIPAGTPPGRYMLDIQLYDPQNGQALDVINADGNPVDERIRLEVMVERPDAPPTVDTLAPEVRADVPLDGVTLSGVDSLPEAASVGDFLTLASVWQIERVPEALPALTLVWITAEGDEISGPSFTAHDGTTGLWQSGDVWRLLTRVTVPGDLEPGDYTVELRAGTAAVRLGEMIVTAPERVYALPDGVDDVGARWSNGIELAGLTRTDSGVTLYWRTDAPLTDDLRVFVHAVDADGRILAQVDRVPADWTRPVAGWAVGEIVTDAYTLAVPDGASLVTGWYHAQSRSRVLLTDSADTLTLD